MQRALFIPVFAWLAAFSAAAQTTHTVVARPNNTFDPAELTIQEGDSVTWTNNGGLHNVQADDNSFRCANGCDGQGGNGAPSSASWSFTLTFNDSGEIPYFCEIHGSAGGVGMSGTVTVQSGGGGPPPPAPNRFKSGFEAEDFTDWDDHVCPSCNVLAAVIAEGDSIFPQGGSGYKVDRAGEHWAHLEGPSDSDFDLILWWWNGSEWISVASGISPFSEETVAFQGEAGLYRWEVRSASGEGAFVLSLAHPNLVEGATNQLIRSAAARKRGGFGVESVYFEMTRNRDYLLDELPVNARRYEAVFWIKPLEGLTVAGKKQQILQLRQGGRAIVNLFLWAPEEEGGDHRLALRVRQGNGRFTPPASATLKTDRWRKVTVEWRAASEPGAADGEVSLRVGSQVAFSREDLDNQSHRINTVRFGQVNKGKKRTAGQVYFDNFNSNWEE